MDIWKPSSHATLSFWAIWALRIKNSVKGTRRVAEARTDLHPSIVGSDMYRPTTATPEAQPPWTSPGIPRPLPHAVSLEVLADMPGSRRDFYNIK